MIKITTQRLQQQWLQQQHNDNNNINDYNNNDYNNNNPTTTTTTVTVAVSQSSIVEHTIDRSEHTVQNSPTWEQQRMHRFSLNHSSCWYVYDSRRGEHHRHMQDLYSQRLYCLQYNTYTGLVLTTSVLLVVQFTHRTCTHDACTACSTTHARLVLTTSVLLVVQHTQDLYSWRMYCL